MTPLQQKVLVNIFLMIVSLCNQIILFIYINIYLKDIICLEGKYSLVKFRMATNCGSIRVKGVGAGFSNFLQHFKILKFYFSCYLIYKTFLLIYDIYVCVCVCVGRAGG